MRDNLVSTNNNKEINNNNNNNNNNNVGGRIMVFNNDTFLMRINELEEQNSRLTSRVQELETINQLLKEQVEHFLTKNLERSLYDNIEVGSCLSDIYNSLSINTPTIESISSSSSSSTSTFDNNNQTKHTRSKTEKLSLTNNNNSLIPVKKTTPILTRSNSETLIQSPNNIMSPDRIVLVSSQPTTQQTTKHLSGGEVVVVVEENSYSGQTSSSSNQGRNANWSAAAITPKQRSESIVVGINPNKDPFLRLNNNQNNNNSNLLTQSMGSPSRIGNSSPQNSSGNLSPVTVSPSTQSPPFSPISSSSSSAFTSGSVHSSPQMLSSSPPLSISSSINTTTTSTTTTNNNNNNNNLIVDQPTTTEVVIRRRPAPPPLPQIPNNGERRSKTSPFPTNTTAPLSGGAGLTRTQSAAPKPITVPPPSSSSPNPNLLQQRPSTPITTSSESIIVDDVDDQDDNDDNIDDPNLVLVKNENDNYLVKGGTLEKLVQRLSYDKSHDTDFASAFLLTYRSFTTPTELMDMLIRSYNNISGDSTNAEKKRKITRLRVANVIKMWLGEHFHDFEEDSVLILKLDQFINHQIIVDIEGIGRNLKKLLYHEKQTPIRTFSTLPPPSIAPKVRDPTFLDLDPTEVARQLTLIESDLYRKIGSKECLNQGWNKTDKEERSPNILAFIRRFNAVSTWVATEIVRAEKLKERVSIIKRFILTAQKCLEMGNFNGLWEILSGLRNSAIHRLHKTWEKIDSKPLLKNSFDELVALMLNTKNYSSYRAALHNCHPPCIPYLGVYLTDLTFIEDGMKNTLNNSEDLINFEKRRKISVVIREIKQYQQSPYNLHYEENTSRYLKTLPSLTLKALDKASLACEPREPQRSSSGSDSPNNSSNGPSLKKEISGLFKKQIN